MLTDVALLDHIHSDLCTFYLVLLNMKQNYGTQPVLNSFMHKLSSTDGKNNNKGIS